MNTTNQTVLTSEPRTATRSVSHSSKAIPGTVRLRIELQSTNRLMDVMTTISRVGGQINAVTAVGTWVDVTVSARPLVARRIQALIDQLPSVIQTQDVPLN